jgi:hypothetical protein
MASTVLPSAARLRCNLAQTGSAVLGINVVSLVFGVTSVVRQNGSRWRAPFLPLLTRALARLALGFLRPLESAPPGAPPARWQSAIAAKLYARDVPAAFRISKTVRRPRPLLDRRGAVDRDVE